ncbi:hypothetical protein KSF_014700 [Reticulibacter mediterranei]|uniref:Uncharacterized protein n=1 Tax=Reticulibacter mediterranei TaxID=2778369 RepID=A0A8J3IH77_9CHLR|nr:hypothetical protein [Reticulibacter mediterranei]GHO91422.1 hypothetical protein KSF_014700 [Reticulibacter mediterranei]
MNGASFDLIAHELLKQKYIMEKLLEENRELRRQIAQLRAGHGIFVEIGGQRIALNLLLEDAAPATPVTRPAPAAQPAKAIAPITPAPQTEESADLSQPTDPRIPVIPKAAAAPPRKQENEKKAPSTFLEEMMVDEFSAAMTSQTAVWTGPAKQPEITDDEEKAALRKQLMGSFLLE